MPTFQTFNSLRASTRVLSLWNGSSNNSPPTGWETPGFDDSAWPLSSTPTVTAHNPYGAEEVAPWTTAPSRSARFLVRMHFAAPADPFRFYWQAYQVTLDNHGDAFINGHNFLPQGYGNIAAIDGAGWFLPGADNLVAYDNNDLSAANYWPASLEAWAAFQWVVYVPDVGGLVYSWGTITTGVNDKGVLGTGDTATHLTPTLFDASGFDDPTAPNVVKVASNGKTTFFLTSTGDLYSCGDNSTSMALANGTNDTLAHPTPARFASPGIFSPMHIVDVSIGDDCILAMRRNGDILGWGPNAHGSLGRGNTTAQRIATTLITANANTPIVTRDQLVSAGKNFSAVCESFSGGNFIAETAGQNTYGQLGQGTSGADVLTRAACPTGHVQGMSAGDDGMFSWTTSGDLWVCGRAEFGALGRPAFLAGTGTNKIVSTPMQYSGVGVAATDVVEAKHAGPVSFVLTEGGGGACFGDGTPHGGAGDPTAFLISGVDNFIYGTSAHAGGQFILMPEVASFFTSDLANINGGSQNQPYSVGNSLAVFAAVGDVRDDTLDLSTPPASNGKLYIWGWGGAGQMGSGADPIDNFGQLDTPLNGLRNVIGATVCAAGMFAIATAATVVARGGGGWVAVIG